MNDVSIDVLRSTAKRLRAMAADMEAVADKLEAEAQPACEADGAQRAPWLDDKELERKISIIAAEKLTMMLYGAADKGGART